jgi:enamine deaminase RidA (YjgF/YER057c/UK114 family)
MRSTIFSWLDREFVGLSGEGTPGLGAAEATRELLGRFGQQLAAHGLSLDDAVRNRLFARDRASWQAGSPARRDLLSDATRTVSSSFIDPGRFDSGAAVALDLLAMRPRQPGTAKTMREYDPPRFPLRYLDYDSVVFLSGVTSEAAGLEAQVAAILAEIGESLAMAGSGWARVTLLSCFLQRDQSVSALQRLLRQSIPGAVPRLECELVAGFAGEAYSIEIEATAVR